MSDAQLIDLPTINRRDGVTSPETCKTCGGRCCQQAAGIAHPSDFGPRDTLVPPLESYFRTGFWAVDWWEGDIEPGGPLALVYYVRPAHANAKGKLRDPSWGGSCALWSREYGCSLAFENRPHECRNLTPNPDFLNGSCGGKPKEWYVAQWRPYQREIEAAMALVEADE